MSHSLSSALKRAWAVIRDLIQDDSGTSIDGWPHDWPREWGREAERELRLDPAVDTRRIHGEFKPKRRPW